MSAHAAAPCANALMRRRFRHAHDRLDTALEGLLAEAIHRRPPLVRVAQNKEEDPPTDMVASAGACYARGVLCEDLSVSGMLAAGMPLALSTWAGRTGLGELPLLAGPIDWRAWARRARLDMAELRPYARAVYAATDTYLAALPALDPARGELTGCVLNALLQTLALRCGEIAKLRRP